MAVSTPSGPVIGAEVDLTIIAGRNLVAKDGSGLLKLGKNRTSDPYCVVRHMGKLLGKTQDIKKCLDPEWNATFKFHLEGRSWRPDESIVLAIYDFDTFSNDDPMGEVVIPLRSLMGGLVVERWFPVQNCVGCKDAKGDLHVKISTLLRHALSLEARQSFPLRRSMTKLAVGLGWDMLPGNRSIDLDASCVVVDFQGRVLMDECVHFAQLHSRSRALQHTGDEREGDEDLGQGDDEIITVNLTNLPQNVCALHFIASVATEGKSFADVKSSRMRLVDWASGNEECRFSARLHAHGVASLRACARMRASMHA